MTNEDKRAAMYHKHGRKVGELKKFDLLKFTNAKVPFSIETDRDIALWSSPKDNDNIEIYLTVEEQQATYEQVNQIGLTPTQKEVLALFRTMYKGYHDNILLFLTDVAAQDCQLFDDHDACQIAALSESELIHVLRDFLQEQHLNQQLQNQLKP